MFTLKPSGEEKELLRLFPPLLRVLLMVWLQGLWRKGRHMNRLRGMHNQQFLLLSVAFASLLLVCVNLLLKAKHKKTSRDTTKGLQLASRFFSFALLLCFRIPSSRHWKDFSFRSLAFAFWLEVIGRQRSANERRISNKSYLMSRVKFREIFQCCSPPHIHRLNFNFFFSLLINR